MTDMERPMTDEPKPTYEELEASNEQLERQLKYVRDERDTARAERADAIKSGGEWRDLANERKTLVDNLRDENKHRVIEAAELRGYIKRVNELDPKRVRQRQRVEHTGLSERELRKMQGY